MSRMILSTFCVHLILIASVGPCFAQQKKDDVRKLILQSAPAGSVDSVAVSPDGTIVATGAGEGGVRLYDAKTGKFIKSIGAAGDRSICFSADSKQITAGGYHMDKLVGLWDLASGKRTQTFVGQTEWEADACRISPDGKLLASTGTDKQILIWEIATGKLRHQLPQSVRINALAFTPDSTTLIAGGGNKLLQCWNMVTGQVAKELSGHTDWISSIAVSPDGKRVASGSCDWGFHRGYDWIRPSSRGSEHSEWRLWDLESGQQQRVVNEAGRVLAISFTPDGKSVACAAGHEVRLYDLGHDGPAKVIARHEADVKSIAFTPDGTSIVSGGNDYAAARTNLATGQIEWRAPGYFDIVTSVALSHDATLLVTGNSDNRFARTRLLPGTKHIGTGSLRLWDLRTGTMIQQLGNPAEQILSVAITEDGGQIAAGGGIVDGASIVKVWQKETGRWLWTAADHAREVVAVAFSRDGKLIASGSADGAVKIRDAATGVVRQALEGHRKGATSIVFSPDAKRLYCGEGFGGFRMWDVQTGQSLQSWAASSNAAETFGGDRLVNTISLSRDGKVLATCASSVNNEFVDNARLWDTATGMLTRDFAPEKMHGQPAVLSSDASLIATGGKAVQLWDAKTGKQVRKLMGHLKRTQSTAFSSDGRLVVSGGSYGTVNIWETATGRHLVTLFMFSQSPNGEPVNDWLTYHNDGFYQGSPAVEKYLAWRAGEEFQTAKQLSDQFHRPDMIATILKRDQ